MDMLLCFLNSSLMTYQQKTCIFSNLSPFMSFVHKQWPLLHPQHRGVFRVSQSDLSCWMPLGSLFVKLLCSVCSLTPPGARWQGSHCEPEGHRFVLPDTLEMLWSGEVLHTHTSCVVLWEHLLTYLLIIYLYVSIISIFRTQVVLFAQVWMSNGCWPKFSSIAFLFLSAFKSNDNLNLHNYVY